MEGGGRDEGKRVTTTGQQGKRRTSSKEGEEEDEDENTRGPEGWCGVALRGGDVDRDAT